MASRRLSEIEARGSSATAVTYGPHDRVQLPDFSQTDTFELSPMSYLPCDFGSDAA